MEVTIIHLSDLHFKNDAENRFRLDRLRSDLERLQTGSQVFTAFTGDLVQSGDENDYALLFEELISPLISYGHDIFLVPGNHDVQRELTSNDFSDSCLQDHASSYLFESNGSIRQYHPEKEFDALQNYKQLEDLFDPYEERNYWGYSATRKSVSFVGLNSTWLSCARQNGNSDRGFLRVEPFVLTNLIKQLPQDTLKVALLHHPLDWLEEGTRDAVSSQLIKEFDLVLFGHVHTCDASNLMRDHSNCLFIQSPPLRAGWSKGTNGYAILRCNTSHRKYEIEYRSYSATRREFVIGEDYSKNGIRYPRSEDEEFFKNKPLQSSLIQKFVDTDKFDFLDWYRNNIRAKKKELGDFVSPKASRKIVNKDGCILEPPNAITKIAISSMRDQFFIAPMDSGVTTAAYLTFRTLAENFSAHEQIPAFFDANNGKINKASILSTITKSSLVRYSRKEVETLAEEGAIVVVVDGLSLSNIQQFNLFRQTASQYFAKVRFVYFLKTEQHGIASTKDDELNLCVNTDEIYEFAQLEVADIRSMVNSRCSDLSPELVDGVVNQVVECFGQMDEPIYASTVSVVIDTLEQDPEFKPINKARLIERYIECLLGRFDISDVQEGTFTSSDKIDLLSFIARKLLETGKVGVSEDEWDNFTSSYKETYLIELPSNLLDEFMEKGILTLENELVTFRGDHLFSFFIARQMKTDAQFAIKIISGECLFKHHREIVVYGELEGTNVGSVLDSLYNIIGEIETTLIDNYAREKIDLRSEWANTCKDSLSDSKDLENATNRLEQTTPTPEQADRIDDARLAQVQRKRGIALRGDVKEAEARLLLAMKLYGSLLKNALQLEAQDKLRHLNKLFSSADLWVGFICACREAITRYPVVIAGGVRFINARALINPEKSEREFKFDAPRSVSQILAEVLRNPQLARAIREVLPTLSPMSSLFARDVLLEMTVPANKEIYVESLMKESDINLVTASLKTLREKYLATGRSKARQKHISDIVNSVGGRSKVASCINIDKLKKVRLVQDLKEKARKAS